jgi:hypothetical protein
MSKGRAVAKFHGESADIQRLQKNLETAVAQAIKSPLLDGRIIPNVTLASGDNKIEHKLARTLRGYLVIDRTNGATIYRTSIDDKYLTLNSSAQITVSLWVF